MKRRQILAAAAAALAFVALPLGAQTAQPVEPAETLQPSQPVRTAAIVVTAERVDERTRLLQLQRGNRFLANELRNYDRRVAVLETRLTELKDRAVAKENEIGALNARRDEARAARLRLEALVASAEAAGGTTGSSEIRAAKTGGE